MYEMRKKKGFARMNRALHVYPGVGNAVKHYGGVIFRV
jgi:hypothetical protein